MKLQIKELNSQGYEIILVSSGAVGLGRQRLKYRRLINSRSLFYSTFVWVRGFWIWTLLSVASLHKISILFSQTWLWCNSFSSLTVLLIFKNHKLSLMGRPVQLLAKIVSWLSTTHCLARSLRDIYFFSFLQLLHRLIKLFLGLLI